jgi:hypothetical protein
MERLDAHTSAAVIVSLFIALRRPRPSLRVVAALSVMIWPHRRERPEFLSIEVINQGTTEVVVMSVGWKVEPRFLWGAPKWAHQDVSSHGQPLPNPTLPQRLLHGQGAQFFLSVEGQHGWFEQIEERGLFADVLTSRGSLKRLRVVAHTSVGHTTAARPNRELLARIWTAQRQFLEEKRRLDAAEADVSAV